MAKWIITNKTNDLHDIVYPMKDGDYKILTKSPQPLNCVFWWLFEPEQAGWWDVIVVDGSEHSVMEPGIC